MALLVAVMGGCSVPYILHNRALAQVGADYARITHPTSSSTLGSFSEVGIAAGGNGNHCDYLVGEIREGDDASEQIKAHYSAFTFPMLDRANSQWATGEPGQRVPVTVEFPGSSADSGVMRWDIPDLLRTAQAKQRKKTLYVVYILDGGYEPNGDLRCH